MANYQSSYTGTQIDNPIFSFQALRSPSDITLTVQGLGSTKTLTLDAADSTGAGVITTEPQTLVGEKTFSNATIFNDEVDVNGNLTVNGYINFSNYSGLYTLNRLPNISGSTHAIGLQDYFTNNYEDTPRDTLITHYSTAYSNGSLAMGYYLNGYDTTPYGGFYIAHYNRAFYVGIQAGVFTQYDLLKVNSANGRIVVWDDTLLSSSRNGVDQNIYGNGFKITGNTYGNDATSQLGNVAGQFRYGDGGPQIVFSSGGQNAALIFTDHDSAGTGTSFHFVSDQGTNAEGGNCTVTMPRLRVRSTSDVQHGSNTAHNAPFVIGPEDGAHTEFDNNEVIYKSNATDAGTWTIQQNVDIHGPTSPYTNEAFSLRTGTAFIKDGLLRVQANGNRVDIGSQNAGFCHIYNSANVPFIFNKTVTTTSGDLGTSGYNWSNLYLSGVVYHQGTGPRYYQKITDVNRGTAPGTNRYGVYDVQDSQGRRLGDFEVGYLTNRNIQCAMLIQNTSGTHIGFRVAAADTATSVSASLNGNFTGQGSLGITGNFTANGSSNRVGTESESGYHGLACTNSTNNAGLNASSNAGVWHAASTGSTTGKWLIYIGTNGTVTANTSDKRWKIDKGLADQTEAINILSELPIINFVYKEDEEVNNLEQSGIFAQDLRDILLKYNYKNRSYLHLFLNKGVEEYNELRKDLSYWQDLLMEPETEDSEFTYEDINAIIEEIEKESNELPDYSKAYYDITLPEEDYRYEMNYTALIPLLVQGFQAHQEEIKQLKEENALLKQLINEKMGVEI